MLAQLKGCSIYLPERHYPMLPDRVSQERFSLGKGGCAMTFSARLAEDGEIADWGVCLSQLADVRVCHYRDVNQAIGWQDEPSAEAYGTVWERKAAAELRGLGKSGGGMDEKARAELRALAGEAARHMRWRVKQGGLNSNQPGLSVKVEPYPSPMTPPLSLAPLTPEEVRAGAAAVWLDPNQVGHVEPASRMVSECMVIAGRVAAKWCQEMGVPAIYRTQASLLDGLEEGSAGRGRVLAALEGVDADTGLLGGAAYRAVLPYFSPARSSLVLGGHGSMGIPGPRGADGVATESEMVGYVKVTSPLRRYKDLLMHWMMKARILELSRGGGAGVARTAPPFRDVDLEPLVARLAECERRQKKVMSGSERLWALEWIRRREVLWRGGATREVVDGRWRPSGKAVPHLGEGLRLPYVGGGGPREAQIWGGRYGANVTGFGEKEDLWAAAAEERCERPVYEVMVVRVDEGGNGAGGFLADLGGLQCRIQFANGSGMKEGGQLVKAVVEAVDPPAGVLMMSEI
ncbi:hypothetical protein HK101_011630 [Irineochytrium annulatum]|nr:hypothetical protein HK101_011630 [Irineochytrium annulatum]